LTPKPIAPINLSCLQTPQRRQRLIENLAQHLVGALAVGDGVDVVHMHHLDMREPRRCRLSSMLRRVPAAL
jgi:hypothetical protein